jgi:peroxiredoxin
MIPKSPNCQYFRRQFTRLSLTATAWIAVVLSSLISTVATAQTAVAPPSSPPVLLQMIRDDLVHQDLGLTEPQIESVQKILQSIDPRWFRARNFQPDKLETELVTLTSELRTKLQQTLTPAHMKRLAQLERQALGTRMIIRDDVAQELGLSASDQQRFIDAFVKTDADAAAVQAKVKSGDMEASKAESELGKIQARERKLFADRLSNQQRAKLPALTGKPFNFSLVKRTYPMPPELSEEGVTWIQGGPLKLDDLQGKVVAVHYYAFQCINCQRNLPHYKAWYQDYADQGLVIIGIQTPETSAERSLDRVKAAAAKEGIEYPVMLDAKSENWKQWSNTMWPTVYLIDKKGFLRRWWQGEMNWKGTPGEQQMRQTIETLLEEEG